MVNPQEKPMNPAASGIEGFLGECESNKTIFWFDGSENLG